LSYLTRLTNRLAKELDRLPQDFRDRHANFIRSRRHTDGGYSGRADGSDLYYTGFALRGLAALRQLDAESGARTAQWLKSRLTREAPIVDFVSLLYGARVIAEHGGIDILADAREDWPTAVTAALEAYRTPDGGYAKTLESASGSTYHSFLVGLCYQLAGKPIPEPGKLAKFVLSRQREDGGFVEIPPMKRGGTNPTAAAIGLLAVLAEVPGAVPEAEGEEAIENAVEFLAELQSPMEGGFSANTRVLVCDLLSSFTAMLTLIDLGAADRIEMPPAARFVYGCERPEGGFRGGIWDEAVDVEYTFYGLGAAALIGPLEDE